jgi:hypothetical protein
LAGLLGWVISLSEGRYLHKEQHIHRINAHRHPCLEWDWNPEIPAFELDETVHALERAATVVIGFFNNLFISDGFAAYFCFVTLVFNLTFIYVYFSAVSDILLYILITYLRTYLRS